MKVGDRRVVVRFKRDSEYGCPGSSQVWQVRAGDEATLIERPSSAGVRYWTDYDIDLAYIVRPEDIEIVSVVGEA